MSNNNAQHLRLFKATTIVSLFILLPLNTEAQPPQKVSAASQKPLAALHAGKHMINSTYDYILNVGSNPYAYTVRVNGWTLDHSPGAVNNRFSTTRLGLYLVQGKNTVSIHIEPAPKGVTPGDKFEVQVQTVQGAVVSYLWNPAKPHAPLPVQAEAHFEVPHLPHGPWAWQTAPKITLDAPTKQAINAHVKRLFDALNTKNADKATALFALRNREDAATDDTPAAEADASSHANWVQEFAVPHWRLDAVDYTHLRYTLEGDGRAVLVQRLDGSDVLRIASDLGDNGGSYDVYLSLIHGQWTLVR